MGKKYWEDLKEGERLPCRPVAFERSDIIFFAKKYDPQPFHTPVPGSWWRHREMWRSSVESGWMRPDGPISGNHRANRIEEWQESGARFRTNGASRSWNTGIGI